MKIRNNVNKDFQLILTNGKVINLSRAEIYSLELGEEQDPAVIKALKNRWIVQYIEPNIENIKNIKVAEKKVSQVGEDKEQRGEEEKINRRFKKSKFGQKED